jgi:2-dehydro-3-deoxyphosphogluconate aldolase/(4S)-4-hydroxy-2-oxoglutarate aldolase
VRAIKKAFPQMLVGAGTLLEVEQVKRARDAGAQFGVAPGLNDAVVKASLSLGMPFVPGVMTPSEVERGLALGCKLQKFFPASTAGGVEMVKALAAPYAHTGLKLIPLGGLNVKNAPDYLKLPIVAAIGGSWIAEKKLIAAKDWPQITILTKEIVGIAATITV